MNSQHDRESVIAQRVIEIDEGIELQKQLEEKHGMPLPGLWQTLSGLTPTDSAPAPAPTPEPEPESEEMQEGEPEQEQEQDNEESENESDNE